MQSRSEVADSRRTTLCSLAATSLALAAGCRGCGLQREHPEPFPHPAAPTIRPNLSIFNDELRRW